jgi:hypothetical protein
LAVLTSVVMWWWVGRLRLGSASKGGIEAPH